MRPPAYAGGRIYYVRSSELVDFLLESDDDLDTVLGYLDQAHVPWNPIRLISKKEWRAFFRGLGYKVAYIYQHRASGKRRYAHASLTLVPLDGHPVDHYDSALLSEYTYEMLEKRFNKKRWLLDVVVDSYPYSIASGAFSNVKANQIEMRLAIPDPDPKNYCHALYYPMSSR